MITNVASICMIPVIAITVSDTSVDQGRVIAVSMCAILGRVGCLRNSKDVEIPHETGQCGEPEGAVLERDRFQRIVADAALAAHEQHAGRRQSPPMIIVSCAAPEGNSRGGTPSEAGASAYLLVARDDIAAVHLPGGAGERRIVASTLA